MIQTVQRMSVLTFGWDLLVGRSENSKLTPSGSNKTKVNLLFQVKNS